MSNIVVTLVRPEIPRERGPSRYATARHKRSTLAFTETRLALLRATGREVVHYDTNSPLAVRLSPAGAKTYILYKWIDGRPVKLRLGRVGEVLLDDARREARRAMAAIAAHRDPAAERKAARQKGMTLAELWDLWQARKAAMLRPRSREGFDGCWRVHIEPALGRTVVVKLTRADIQRLVDRIAASGRRGTARKIRGILHLLLAEGVRLDVVQANAAAGVEAPAYVARARVVQSDEREPLLAAIEQAGEPWRDFFTLLLLTGARVSSMCSMAWAGIDLDAAIWRIPAGRSKSGHTTSLPLPPGAVAILRGRLARRAGEPWVFVGRGRDGHVTGYDTAWAGVLDRAGIAGLTRHDLRRSLATTMASQGASEYQIGAALGHRSMTAVRAYVHLSAEIARGAVASAAAAMTARKGE